MFTLQEFSQMGVSEPPLLVSANLNARHELFLDGKLILVPVGEGKKTQKYQVTPKYD